jgi:hypothetical protein
MIKTMTAQALVPHFGYCDEIVFDEVIKLRSAVKASAAASGVKFSYLPVVLKAVSLSLLRFPQLNAKITQDMGSLEHFASHNIGAPHKWLHTARTPTLCLFISLSLCQLSKFTYANHELQVWPWQLPLVLLFPTSKTCKRCLSFRSLQSSRASPTSPVAAPSPHLI